MLSSNNTMKLIPQLMQKKSYYLPLLLIISIATHFPFVLKGFGEMDATKIAVSVIDMINHGSQAAFANFYFTDVIPLYVLYLKWCMKLLNYNYSYLPLVMNYTNAVIGTLTIIPAFYLINNLFKNAAIAFCSVLALIFAPSFYQASIMGFPHLIALFFLLISLCFYLSGLENNNWHKVYFLMLLSCVFLTIAFLFKADYVLAVGIYFGFLLMRSVRDKKKITCAFIIVFVSSVLFLFFRYLIIGSTGGTTMSGSGMSKWFNFFFIGKSLNLPFLIEHINPIAYGAGIATFFLGIISLIYFLVKRKFNILIFIVSWATAPTLLWLIIHGNNARHSMLTVLPLLVVTIFLLYELFPRFVLVLTVVLIFGNFIATTPSSSILRPSGSLFESHTLLKDRMNEFHLRAEEISNIDNKKIVVLGYFHNPHVIFELMRSALSYKAVKIGREDYDMETGNREFVFLYIDRSDNQAEIIEDILKTYQLTDYVLVSATYDLTYLNKRGFKTKTLQIITATN